MSLPHPPAAELYVFDVDHTITRHSTGRRFAELGRRRGFVSLQDFLTLPILYLRYRYGLLTIEDVDRPLTPLAGMRREELEALGQECFEDRSRRDIYPGMERHIRSIREEGREVVLASTSFSFLLEPFARHFEAVGLICSHLEYDDDVATGRLDGPPCYAAEKARRTVAYCEKLGVPMERVSFYSDSHQDLALLEQVGAPVVVNPDRRLRRRANEAGWQVLRPE
ncbi:MAG: HAD family hydrolase [Alkalispirochaetaceae bacterium]